MTDIKVITITELDLTRLVKNAVAMGIKDYQDMADKDERLTPRQLAKRFPQYKEGTYREWIRKGVIGEADRKGRLTATRAEIENYLYRK